MNDPAEVPEAVATYDLVSAALDRMVGGVQPAQWSGPTPCTDWDTRQLVNHIVGGMLLFVANIDGSDPRALPRDHLGDDAAAAFASANRQLHDAFVRPGVMDRMFPSPLGTAAGSALAQMRTVEHLVHGWDLGRATGQALDVPVALVEQTLTGMRQVVAGGHRDAGGFFGDEQPCAAGAPALDRLAAFLGRRVEP